MSSPLLVPQLVIPMSGQGTRYQRAGYTMPKPLVPVNGIPMIERLLSAFPLDWPTHYIVAENHLKTELPAVLKKLRPQAGLHSVSVHSKGPGHALLETMTHLESQSPVLVSYCDYGMVWDPRRFQRFVSETRCDACVVSYRGFHAHYLNPVTYAFSRLEGDLVREVREKGSFTSNRENEWASCGAYYFRSAEILKRALEFQIEAQLELNGEYYTSLTVEALLRTMPSAHVRTFEIPYFHQWGTPEDLRVFEYWEKTFAARNREPDAAKKARSEWSVGQVLMPMAGAGSRFQALTELPKPLIPVDGEPMFKRALASLPVGQETRIVALESFAQKISVELPSSKITALDKTPSGQALSTQAGALQLNPHGDVVVSSCDHAIVLGSEKWARFRQNPDCDAAIFTVVGFPGTLRKPLAFAYVVPELGPEFPLVRAVSVKKPVSEIPSKDALLVGTFWFRSSEILLHAIELLKKKDRRVNGELYLDSVFELLVEEGRKVRTIPLDGYINWGDPESYKEALYWQENFQGYRIREADRV